ncbi:protein HUA2-LIKE 2-like [Papaver somniferum]|uniref:protein HUA2-LIKE 2-like n=1 Tax=Papaver somniferum TaxID=3469 RepID=UPI000E6F7519|nr:protein HUA2-LIKE 2-like [Papaver somniferum]
MAPSRRRGGGKASSTAAAAKKQWKIGDLVLAKVKGFPAWPATVSEPEKWGYSTDWKKVLVYFFGTKQIAFCNPADVEAFTEEKKKTLLGKRQGKGSDFVRAVEEIIDCFEKSKKQEGGDEVNSGDEGTVSNTGDGGGSIDKSSERNQRKSRSISADRNGSHNPVEVPVSAIELTDLQSEEPAADTMVPDHPKEKKLSASNFSRKRSREKSFQNHQVVQKRAVRKSRSSVKVDSSNFETLIMAVDDVSKNDDDDDYEVPNVKRNRRMRKTFLDDAVWHDTVSPVCLTTCVSNDSSGDNTSEIVATNSDTVSLNEGSTLESTCKSENPDPAEDYINGDVQVCATLHVQAKALVIKKKRKLNRKRIPHSAPRIPASPGKVSVVNVKGENTISISHNATEKVTESYWKADGDEHLPLVKRARVRMSKMPTQEKETHGSICTDDKSSKEASVNNSVSVFSGCLSSSLNGTTSLEMKGAGNGSSSTTSSNRCTSNEPPAWKPKKFQFRGCSVDGEAALPPSKRLHRALEAMSANVAENVQEGNTENQGVSVTISSNGGSSYQEKGSSQAAMNKEAENSKIGSVFEAGDAEHSCDEDRNMSGRSEMIGTLTSPSCEMPTKASSEEKSCERKEMSSEAHSSKIVIDLDDASFDTRSRETEFPIEPSHVFSEKHNKLELTPGVIDPCKLSPMDQDDLSIPSNQCFVDRPKVGDLPPLTDPDRENGTSRTEVWSSKPAPEAKDSPRVSPASHSNLLLSGGRSCLDTKFSESPSDENTEVADMCEVVREVQEELVVEAVDAPSSETTMKGLIAAAQAKRQLPRTTSLSDDPVDDKVVSDTTFSPFTNNRLSYLEKVTPHNSSICHLLTLDNHNNHLLHNGSGSPEVPPHCKKPSHVLEMDKEGKMEPVVSNGQLLSKGNACETSSARKLFEGFLGTLSRTKDSIGKATRLAIDCIKCGIAGEVVEILARSLENESNLPRRVDLFFLVDSITQCSRGQKGICLAGDTGDAFLSAIQAALPRLLAFAAPPGPGSVARENRKQCLKVLKLWLERKTLPESVIRHHMQEIDSADAPFIGSSSRRPSRTERSLDDPVREMEGMLVDEYGSNANFQLAGILMPRMLEVEEEGSDTDEKSFEAVTPEHEQPEIHGEREATPTSIPTIKHHHILEAVDGELEMEDVAPSCIGDIDSVHISQGQYEQRLQLPFAPPLPEDRPPSPPPLPSSPPPLPSSSQLLPLPPPPPPPLPSVHSFVDNADPNYYANACSLQNGLQLPTPHQPGTGNANSLPSDTVHTHYYGYKEFVPPMQRSGLSSSSDPSCSFPGPPHTSIQTGNNAQHIDGAAALHNKNYHLQPPPPMLSNQFSYVQADQRAHSWMEASSSSFTKRFQFGHDMHRDNMYDSSQERMQHEIDERCRLPPPPIHPGPVHSDNTDSSYAPSYYGPPDVIPNREWSYPPRSLNYRHSTPHRRPEISGENGASNFWRPR